MVSEESSYFSDYRSEISHPKYVSFSTSTYWCHRKINAWITEWSLHALGHSPENFNITYPPNRAVFKFVLNIGLSNHPGRPPGKELSCHRRSTDNNSTASLCSLQKLIKCETHEGQRKKASLINSKEHKKG